MVNYKTVRKFSAESGYTEAAIRAKMSDGTWTENLVWRHAPDRRVLIDVRGYEAWVESTIALFNQPTRLKPSEAHQWNSNVPP